MDRRNNPLPGGPAPGPRGNMPTRTPLPPPGGPGGPGGARGPGGYRGPPPPAAPAPAARPIPLRLGQLDDRSTRDRYIYGNLCAVSPRDFPPNGDGSDHYVLLRGPEMRASFAVMCRPTPGFPDGTIYMSDPQRTWCGIALNDTFQGEIYDPFASGNAAYIGGMDVEVGFASARKISDQVYDHEVIESLFLKTYGNQLLAPGQRLIMDVKNIPISVLVRNVQLVDLALLEKGAPPDAASQSSPNTRGILVRQTRLSFYKDPQSPIKLKGSGRRSFASALISPDFDFNSLGIGGLDAEFAQLFRRAFTSRILPPNIIANVGSRHCKGILLHGPPGTGKTLIARKIGKLLNAREPKIVSGPELLNKYVGASEENVRKLFVDAEKEYKEKGDDSELHIIIFDEFDSIAKQRGANSGGTGVGDNIVNQLLTKLDGVEALNNILIMAMTNRKDLIDDALLRPGRLDVILEISLPDEPGRESIFRIHTTKMRENGHLHSDVDLAELAGLTKNYTGAEIEGVVQNATQWAFSRHIKVGTVAAVTDDAQNLQVRRDDFHNALREVLPAFGMSESSLKDAMPFGIIPWGGRHLDDMVNQVLKYADQIRPPQQQRRVTSVLMHGPPGSGKTALAAHIAILSQIPFVRIISAPLLGAKGGEAARCEHILKVFGEAYRTPVSIVILDEIESLIDYIPVGPRFSTSLLRTILNTVDNPPPKGRGLLVLCTTSNLSILDQLGMTRAFRHRVTVPAVWSLQDVGAIMQQLQMFEPSDVAGALRTVSDEDGDAISLGVKDVIDTALQAQATDGEPMHRIVDALRDRMRVNRGQIAY